MSLYTLRLTCSCGGSLNFDGDHFPGVAKQADAFYEAHAGHGSPVVVLSDGDCSGVFTFAGEHLCHPDCAQHPGGLPLKRGGPDAEPCGCGCEPYQQCSKCSNLPEGVGVMPVSDPGSALGLQPLKQCSECSGLPKDEFAAARVKEAFLAAAEAWKGPLTQDTFTAPEISEWLRRTATGEPLGRAPRTWNSQEHLGRDDG